MLVRAEDGGAASHPWRWAFLVCRMALQPARTWWQAAARAVVISLIIGIVVVSLALIPALHSPAFNYKLL